MAFCLHDLLHLFDMSPDFVKLPRPVNNIQERAQTGAHQLVSKLSTTRYQVVL